MDCNGCGACCLDEAVPVRPWTGDSVPVEFIDEEGCLKKKDGHCIFFDPTSRKCTNYEHRPSLCRSLNAGCARCLLSRLWADLDLDWFGTSARLPGDNSFEAFYSRVRHDEGQMTIVSIDGDHTERTQCAIEQFNALARAAHEW